MKRDISSGPPCCNTGILKQSDNYVSLFLFHQEFSIFYLTLHVKKFIGGQYRWVIFSAARGHVERVNWSDADLAMSDVSLH
jgi:hypothetical protein